MVTLVNENVSVRMGVKLYRVALDFDWPLYCCWTEATVPTGEGYQLWETTTEGSPITPVFASFHELHEYIKKNKYLFGDLLNSAAWNIEKLLAECDSFAPTVVERG